MEMKFCRRTFLGGAMALAVWPKNLFAAPQKGGASSFLTSLWELPNGLATPNVMVRRLYLDLAGRIPTADETTEYVQSSSPNKREELVDKLLSSKDFVDYWTMRFCDILRVKSEFPINLWPNAVYVYHARIRSFVEKDEAWEHFGRALIMSQGSNFRDAEVNFFRATNRRTPEGWAEAVAQTFLGINPSDLDDERRKLYSSYFTLLRIKSTREWKEEIVYVDGEDRRGELCDMIFLQNRQMVQDAFTLRLRQWIFGPAASSVPSTQAYIGGLKSSLKEIVLSREYAQGSVTGGFPARRLDAEILDDVFCSLGDSRRDYQSPAPEPFSFLPGTRPTICMEDGSISSGFLSLFGRPARDTGLMDERGVDITAKQRLYLFNSRDIHKKINILTRNHRNTENAPVKIPQKDWMAKIYWSLLSRNPSNYERKIVNALWRDRRRKSKTSSYFELMSDVAWSLINTKEFLFRI